MGFDNAHLLKRRSGRGKLAAADHWHRTTGDRGRPYVFKSAEQLLDDFFAEVERILAERSVPFDVVTDVEEGN